MSLKNKLKKAKSTQFFDDDVVDGWNKWIEEHDKKVKSDTIDEFSYALRICYKKGRSDGYSQAEKDYFAQSKKDREAAYNYGSAISRIATIDEILEFIGFRNLDDWSQRYINAKDLIDKLNEMKD